MEYIFSLTKNPSVGICSNDNQFVHIERRIGIIDKMMRDVTIQHIEYFDNISNEFKIKGFLQLRRIFLNDKSGEFECVLDYLSDKKDVIEINLNIDKEAWVIKSMPSQIDLEIIKCDFGSDHFDKNHREYYMTKRVQPWINEFDVYLLKRSLVDLKGA